MADVYLAYDEERGGPIAVKVLSDDLAANATYVDRFRREAEIGSFIDHPNVVKCHDAGIDAETGRHFLVMEFIKGQSAQSRLEKKGRFPLSEAVDVVIQIAHGLEELHFREYVHRDVKPGNILVAEDGRAKLADLGVAKLLADSSDLTTLDQGIGTPFYMPWEQTLNASLVDARSDLFALGATFYHMITGRLPFPGKTVSEVSRLKEAGSYKPPCEIDPKLPHSVDAIVAKLLARAPADRIQNAAQLIGVLTAAGVAGQRSTIADEIEDTVQPPANTRPDLKAAGKESGRNSTLPVWQIRFRSPDTNGWRRVKAHTKDVALWFQEGLLPDEFFLAPEGRRTFRHFRKFAEFESLERHPKETKPTPEQRRRFGILGLGIGLIFLGTSIGAGLSQHIFI